MTRYASGTEVSEGRSQQELERILDRFGADEFVYGKSRNEGRVMVGFAYNGRKHRIQVGMPRPDDPEIALTPSGDWARSPAQAEKAYATERKRRWRVLCAFIKALVVGVEEGVLTWEEALLPYALLDTGRTVAEEWLPQLDAALETGQLKQPDLLPGLGETTGVIDVEAVVEDE